ncbi:hypothetical protein HDU87_005639 [Geranomyces variabilis]|uniref:Uncharacterized protein n=1 Tax=Geranomyces variabilis TaxID=109894 RepID=A0AAD5TGL7_9FUNG|nr:hypothetical protein HDU87_005639 [Geranomyces variabilis]
METESPPPLLPDVSTGPNMSTSLALFPQELLEAIFVLVRDPSKLVATSKWFHAIGQKARVRSQWFIAQFGKTKALHAALAYDKLLNPTTLDLLLKSSSVIPRYVLQRAHRLFTETNKAALIPPLITHALQLYDDLSLNMPDALFFYELCDPDGVFSMLERVTFIDVLVETYHFDVNIPRCIDCKPQLAYNEGFRWLLSAVYHGETFIVQSLLSYGMVTHLDKKHSFHLPFGQQMNSTYMSDKPEALIMATKRKHANIMMLLLEHDADRWSTEEGREALRLTLQLAIDDSYHAGVRTILSCSKGLEAPPMSEPALRNALHKACVNDDIDEVQRLIDLGATVDGKIDRWVGVVVQDPFIPLITHGRVTILKCILRQLPVSPEKLSAVLFMAIDCYSFEVLKYLLRNDFQKAPVTARVLRLAFNRNLVDLLPLLLREALKADKTKLVTGFAAILGLAKIERRDDSEKFRVKLLSALEEYRDKVLANKAAEKRKKKTGRKKNLREARERRGEREHLKAVAAVDSSAKKQAGRVTRNSLRAAVDPIALA